MPRERSRVCEIIHPYAVSAIANKSTEKCERDSFSFAGMWLGVKFSFMAYAREQAVDTKADKHKRSPRDRAPLASIRQCHQAGITTGGVVLTVGCASLANFNK